MEEGLLSILNQVGQNVAICINLLDFRLNISSWDGYDLFLLLNFESCAASRGVAFIRGIGPRPMLNLRDLKELD